MWTCMTLLIDIIPSYLEIEVILSTEGGITSKGYHQSVITLLNLAQLFHQILRLLRWISIWIFLN